MKESPRNPRIDAVDAALSLGAPTRLESLSGGLDPLDTFPHPGALDRHL